MEEIKQIEFYKTPSGIFGPPGFVIKAQSQCIFGFCKSKMIDWEKVKEIIKSLGEIQFCMSRLIETTKTILEEKAVECEILEGVEPVRLRIFEFQYPKSLRKFIEKNQAGSYKSTEVAYRGPSRLTTFFGIVGPTRSNTLFFTFGTQLI